MDYPRAGTKAELPQHDRTPLDFSVWVRSAAMIALACLSLHAGATNSNIDRENQIKAAFLFNFAKFIDWPKHIRDQGLQFCAMGTNPLSTALRSIDGKELGGKKITVRRLSESDNILSCQMLYISNSNAVRAEPIIRTAQKNSIVTIGDGEEFARKGGVIGFTRKVIGGADSGRTRIGFAVNIEAARISGVKMRSELLKLATIVQGEL